MNAPEPNSRSANASDRPVDSDPGGTDGVVFLGGNDWWYHPHGHSEIRFAKHIARRTPVLWVNSVGMRRPHLRRTEHAARRYWLKLKSTVRGLARDPETGVSVYSPIFLPSYTAVGVRLNRTLILAQLRHLVLPRLGLRRPSLFVTLPTLGLVADWRGWQRVVFNRADLYSADPETNRPLMETLEKRLLARADHSIYVNRRLHAAETDRARDAVYLGHGVDFDRFASATPGEIPEPDRSRIATLPRPIVGCDGTFNTITMDAERLRAAARAARPGTLLLIGMIQMNLAGVLAEENVVHLPAVQHDRLAAYASVFDVGIMPYLRNEWIERCNPIKLKEYLALGFPIVSTDFPEIEPYRELVFASETVEAFADDVRRAIAETQSEQEAARVERRRAAVREDSWEALGDRVADMLGVAEDVEGGD